MALTENGSVEFGKEQLTFLPFHVLFKGHTDDQPTLNPSSGEESRTPGFTLHWFLKDINGTQVTEKLPARQEDWKIETPTPAYKQPLLDDMVQLAKELRLQNMTKKEILTQVIRRKLHTKMVADTDGDVCFMEQAKVEGQKRVSSNILAMVNTSKTPGEPKVEDIETGYDLYHAVVFCPPTTALKTYKMIDQLLSVETSRTIIQATVNLFHFGAITDESIFTMVGQFFYVLADTLDLQYGSILLATSTTAQLKAVIKKDWPFFTNYTDLVKQCLQESNCDSIQNIYRNIGNMIALLFVNISP